MRRPHAASRWTAVLTACVLLNACATPYGAPRQYAQAPDIKSSTNFCIQHPTLCRPLPGEQMPSVPPPVTGPHVTVLSIAGAAKVVQILIDATLDGRIRQALKECADKARSDVMYRHFQRSPTREECLEVVESDAQGQPVTRAMLLGREQHKVALECAEERLRQLKPGGFTLSPRYRYTPSTGETQLIPPEDVQALLNQGRGAELRGTIEPDLVIHLPGQPLHVQLVFDFKFFCVNGGQTPWREYPKGHPYEGLTQKDVYIRVLSNKVFRVLPHWGVLQ